MVTIPAFVWRGGFLQRAAIIGASFGLCVGLLAWLDSGVVVVGAFVFVIVGSFYGIWNARRMIRYWPESACLTGDQRVAVVRSARTGTRVDDARLADAVSPYSRGLHAAADAARPLRWILRFVLVVAIGTAVFDAYYGSSGNAVASGLYLAALLFEIIWWPRRQAALLTRADHAATRV